MKDSSDPGSKSTRTDTNRPSRALALTWHVAKRVTGLCLLLLSACPTKDGASHFCSELDTSEDEASLAETFELVLLTGFNWDLRSSCKVV